MIIVTHNYTGGEACTKMEYVILDLEWNSSYSKKAKHFISEIIEFGAVKFNDTFEVIDTFSMLVIPQVGKKLSGKIKELTNISNEELATGGATYTHVLSRFKKFLGDSMLLTWGTSDILALMENTDYYEKNNYLDYIILYCDLQRYCAKALGVYNPGRQLGLAMAAQLADVDIADMVQHRALQDAMISMMVFKKLFDKEKLPEYIETSGSLYDRMVFVPYYLTDMDDPRINKSEFSFVCDECRTKLTEEQPWTKRNRSFVALLRCDACGRRFKGKVKFKINYEGMSIKKKLLPCPGPEEENTEEKKEE